MSFCREFTVKATRKPHRCDCCGTMILTGEAATRWAGIIDGDFGTAIFHPECREAEIAYNQICDGRYDEWYQLADMEEDERAWVASEFPIVAARLFPEKATSAISQTEGAQG